MVIEFRMESFIKNFGFIVNCIEFGVNVKGVIRYVGRCVHYLSKSDVLKSLNFLYVSLFSVAPKLETVCPNGFEKCFVNQEFGINGGGVIIA